jgi:ADP-heptose:LPS heptosyltransferase
MDSIGDVLLAGPCIRAVAAGSASVTLLVGPRGRAAADLLPGVDEVLQWCAPWIDPEPPPVTDASARELVELIGPRRFDRALILTSFHQSPLPLALLLRMAGVPWIGAISEDYPGSLLDLRHHVPADPPESVRALSLAEAAGYRLPAGDAGALALRPDVLRGPGADRPAGTGAAGTVPDDAGYLVVHPGASVPARQPSAGTSHRIVAALSRAGHRVVVTGSRAERPLTARVAGDLATDLGGRTDLAGLARVLASAAVVIAPNTGPAHLAAAVGTPVVSLFAPVVPAGRWAPYGIPRVVLGDQQAACRDTRARLCPVAGHPCLAVDPEDVVQAVRQLIPAGRPPQPVAELIGGAR